MLRQLKKKFTPAEYLAMEEVAEQKSEYFAGGIYAMTGGTPDHSLIAVNTVTQLAGRLAETPCRVFNSDMRLNVEASGLFTYPDAMVICGKIELVKKRNDTVTNPLLIVEVLSQSTREYDRGSKFNLYKQVSSLVEYVLIESEEPRVECYRRRESGEWTVEWFEDMGDTATLSSVSCDLPLREVYRKVSWE